MSVIAFNPSIGGINGFFGEERLLVGDPSFFLRFLYEGLAGVELWFFESSPRLFALIRFSEGFVIVKSGVTY